MDAVDVVKGAQTFADIENLYCGSVYPNGDTFAGCETALCLFSAEWLGMQDDYWIAQAGLRGTCVDLNGDNLGRMRELYPAAWEFVTDDAYEFAQRAVEAGSQWDVVTLDPWTGQFQQCADLLPTWATLARRVVVLGHGHYRLTRPEAPEGWRLAFDIKRSDYKGGIYWLVFTKA